ncbi:hydroxypyruvate isomerase family protein [Novipirellula artificiosorum]|uniref:Hydroxypyruvate isomerase n=1 Tax=Novipirellula artificiosorum TaxID=2528016 RepID=A0A5C6E4H5_9BACT|nr:TIM barrel protein [Novipirellula artificiosorum]TWU42897.1 Hydroxypyruvate isomerase [Novipirellula artificiosorum]
MSNSFQPSVCIDAVFQNTPVADAVKIVADCGYRAFEFWGWWDKDLDAVMAARDDHGMTISACCTRFISLVDPALRNDYLCGLEASIEAAKRLNCKTLISQVGDFRTGVPREVQHQSLVDGLTEAKPLLEAAGVTLVIEPLNELVDHVGYYLVRSDEAFAVVDAVNSPNVKVVFDIYHQQISEGHVIHNLTTHIDRIGHFHAAGNPGRHELSRGELNYPQIFDAIRQAGYNGYVGLEYWPLADPAEGLCEVAKWF